MDDGRLGSYLSRESSWLIAERDGIPNPQSNPQHDVSYVISNDLGGPWQSPRLVSCCKTYQGAAVTAEVASSSLVVPAIPIEESMFRLEETFRLSLGFPVCPLVSVPWFPLVSAGNDRAAWPTNTSQRSADAELYFISISTICPSELPAFVSV